jgi:hypothetical protein
LRHLLIFSQLANSLPQTNFDEISRGNFFINMHIVTGRKPKYPRPGDKLVDGTRQEMTASKYDVMKKLNEAKSNQWRRFNLDAKLTTMMQRLRILQGGPEQGGNPNVPITEASDLYVNFQGRELPGRDPPSRDSPVKEHGSEPVGEPSFMREMPPRQAHTG